MDNMQVALETILVVDDEPGVLGLVEVILSRQGYRVLVADSGPKALEICQRHNGAIDLLLTDVMMPGMSGVALAGLLKSLRQNLGVLYMTGGTLESLADGELDPQSALLRKPFDAPSLLSTIRDFLNATGGSRA
jgi:CheY-like chemotaxis protein